MKKDTFELIIERVIEDINSIEVLGSVSKNEVAGLLSISKEKIYKEYEIINAEVKDKYMKFKKRPLDRHKFTAAFMIAILNKLQTKVEKDLGKEYLAIYVGTLFLKIMIAKENKDLGPLQTRRGNTLINFLNEMKKFKSPPKICDDEGYEYNWALAMHYERFSGRLSVTSISNALFWLEHHNRVLAEEWRKANSPGAPAL
ncbi:MAG: hypothetical protein LBI42_09170 [Chitinispirillales bacterium]|nr:hypothetical protein [Chitinispirillales bacterium]